jgi:hypothetical protein
MSTIFKIENSVNSGFGKSFGRLLKEHLQNNTWLALGSGDSDWYQTYNNIQKQFSITDIIETEGKNIINVVVKSLDSSTTYTYGLDYDINEENGIIERLIGGTIEPSQQVIISYIDTFPTPDNETDLLNEKIRRLPFEVSYVQRDDELGEITLQDRVGEKWKRMLIPTDKIYIRFVFEQADIPSETIREMGLFLFGNKKTTVAQEQKYLLPSEIEDKGYLIINRRQEPKQRAADTQDYIDFLLEF